MIEVVFCFETPFLRMTLIFFLIAIAHLRSQWIPATTAALPPSFWSLWTPTSSSSSTWSSTWMSRSRVCQVWKTRVTPWLCWRKWKLSWAVVVLINCSSRWWKRVLIRRSVRSISVYLCRRRCELSRDALAFS